MDLFNPVSPLQIERDEAIGVDAIDTTFFAAPTASVDFVYAPRQTFEESSFGGRLYLQAGNFDVFLMGGEFQKEEVFGGCFDGDIGTVGVHGEFTVTHADDGRVFFRSAIGGQYAFPKNIKVVAEYFYNGGANDNNITEFMTSYEYASRILTLKEHLLGFWGNYEITPLLDFAIYSAYDFQGTSLFINPELKYNIMANLDLKLAVQLFTGSSKSEFGDYNNIYYMQAQYFF